MPKNSTTGYQPGNSHPDYSDLYALDGDVDSWTIGGNTETEANIINANNNMQEIQT